MVVYEMKEPRGQEHWSHTVIPLLLAGIAMGWLLWFFISFLRADW